MWGVVGLDVGVVEVYYCSGEGLGSRRGAQVVDGGWLQCSHAHIPMVTSHPSCPLHELMPSRMFQLRSNDNSCHIAIDTSKLRVERSGEFIRVQACERLVNGFRLRSA
jgi:hypothetical protein